MGVDGSQYVTIRGPKECLDEMEARGLRMDDPANPQIEYVGTQQYFFGPENVKVSHRKPNHIVFSLDYRNEPIYEQMEMLLNKYPKCWMKNEYENELGYCGIWVGRYQHGKPEIQKLKWSEPTIEELVHETDFSRTFGEKIEPVSQDSII